MTTMNKIFIFGLTVLILSACTGENEKPTDWQGEWNATWETDPATFGDVEGITHFTMPGKVTFENDKINIKAYGFEGCAFSIDTLDHSLLWRVSNDSLILINDENTPGMVYQIKEASNEKIRLQLMEDIFLTLEKTS